MSTFISKKEKKVEHSGPKDKIAFFNVAMSKKFKWQHMVSEVSFPRFLGNICVQKCFWIFVSLIGNAISEISRWHCSGLQSIAGRVVSWGWLRWDLDVFFVFWLYFVVFLSFCVFVFLSFCVFAFLPFCLFVLLSFCLFSLHAEWFHEVDLRVRSSAEEPPRARFSASCKVGTATQNQII